MVTEFTQKKIVVATRLSWRKFKLTLSARNSVGLAQTISLAETASLIVSAGEDILVEKSISIRGTGELVLSGNRLFVDRSISDQGTGSVSLSGFPELKPAAKITFASFSARLKIGGALYALVDSLPDLASAIAANPQGSFALANSYDATGDGTYLASPISTNFLGNFEGLGNTISNISVNNAAACCVAGLFDTLSSSAFVSDIHLANVNVASIAGAAGLAYENFGEVEHASVAGTVSGGKTGDIAGLVGDNYGGVAYSSSAAVVSTAQTVDQVNVAGLVAVDRASTYGSFATGAVSAGDGSGNVGGLIGKVDPEPEEGGSPDTCYATGSVAAGDSFNVGGLVGFVHADRNVLAQNSYSIGAISGGAGSTVGGFIGLNDSPAAYDYWDTTTSGTDVGVGMGNASGVTGLTTEQLQSGLPPGFDPLYWAERANINDGFPYLIANPPAK